MFAALDIDRGNISNAVSDNLLDDLGLTTSDYVGDNHYFFTSTVKVNKFQIVLTRGRIWAKRFPRSDSYLPSSRHS